MIEITKPERMQEAIVQEKKTGRRIGVVPTMGFLHEGHAALLREARKENDVVILTVFVNPAQFGPNEDFERYPRDIERDRSIAEREGTDYIFNPSVEDIYPEGYATYVHVEGMTDPLEGEWRPGHFRGVATVVLKLFHITQPDNAYFGQKDAQQLMVIKKMVKDLHLPVTVRHIPTVREENGLAMSSRNAYLSPEERETASVLYRSLQDAQRRIRDGERSREKLVTIIKDTIGETGTISIDYVEIVDPETFRKAERLENNREYCIALAVRIGRTRLIDSVFLKTVNNG
jgi:pantoate--beta-alanine ligase